MEKHNTKGGTITRSSDTSTNNGVNGEASQSRSPAENFAIDIFLLLSLAVAVVLLAGAFTWVSEQADWHNPVRHFVEDLENKDDCWAVVKKIDRSDERNVDIRTEYSGLPATNADKSGRFCLISISFNKQNASHLFDDDGLVGITTADLIRSETCAPAVSTETEVHSWPDSIRIQTRVPWDEREDIPQEIIDLTNAHTALPASIYG